MSGSGCRLPESGTGMSTGMFTGTGTGYLNVGPRRARDWDYDPGVMSKTGLLTLMLVAACHHDRGAAGPMERAGKGVDTAAEKTGTALEGAAVKTGDALNSAGHATGRAFERAGSKLQGKSATPAAPASASTAPAHTPSP